jgi:hypothetical protein
VTARADALAAWKALIEHARPLVRHAYRGTPHARATEIMDEFDQQAALVRAALAPDLPADLAEIQARADAAQSEEFDVWTDEYASQQEASARDVPALVAELAERRAAPQLTAEEAELLINSLGDYWGGHAPDWQQPGLDKLRAIAEQATS